MALLALGVLGLGALGGGGFALAQELTRRPTAAEVRTAARIEVQERWRIRPAGELFPATIPYRVALSAVGEQLVRRVGIAPPISCAQALDKVAADVVVRHGCRTVLRATYVDQTNTRVVTLGVAVMRDTDASNAVEAELMTQRQTTGLRAVTFPGTVAGKFGDAQRQGMNLSTDRTRYVFLSTQGWADGRSRISTGQQAGTFAFVDQLLVRMVERFGVAPTPCTAEGVQC